MPEAERWDLGAYRDLVFDSKLCPSHKLVMLVILHHMRPGQPCAWPSWERISRLASVSRSKLARLLPDLITYDWLVKDKAEVVGRGGRRSDRYWLPRREVLPQVPPCCSRRSKRLANLRQGPKETDASSGSVDFESR